MRAAKKTTKSPKSMARPSLCAAPGSDALAIGAAWLDAELFMRTGDTSCKHSTRLMGYRPRGAENATLVRGTDSPNTQAQTPPT